MFQEFVERPGDHICRAKLRFRDPDLSAELGEDRFLYLWLTSVHYHRAERLFSGAFFEVPAEFAKSHKSASAWDSKLTTSSTGWSMTPADCTEVLRYESSARTYRNTIARPMTTTLGLPRGSPCRHERRWTGRAA